MIDDLLLLESKKNHYHKKLLTGHIENIIEKDILNRLVEPAHLP
jgi:hypothetical protein